MEHSQKRATNEKKNHTLCATFDEWNMCPVFVTIFNMVINWIFIASLLWNWTIPLEQCAFFPSFVFVAISFNLKHEIRACDNDTVCVFTRSKFARWLNTKIARISKCNARERNQQKKTTTTTHNWRFFLFKNEFTLPPLKREFTNVRFGN